MTCFPEESNRLPGLLAYTWFAHSVAQLRTRMRQSVVHVVSLYLVLVTVAVAQIATVPPSRLDHLKHGINIGHLGNNDFPQCCTREQEVDLIKAIGFDHARVIIKPGFVFNFKQPDAIASDKLSALDEVVQTFLSKRIAIIIAISLEEDEFKDKLDKDNDFVEKFADFWKSLAQHYAAKFSPDLVFFEILNEPTLTDLYRWSGIQARLAARIREGAPEHTIVATGPQGSQADGLLFLELLHDPNVIYSFHYYEPYVFTHQGADWGTNYWRYLVGVKYPANADAAKRAAEHVPALYASDRLYLLRELELYNGNGIQTEINQVFDWAKGRGVTVICDEFGVDTKADIGDRATWIRDVRISLEKNNIGWTFWDYSSETFGINGAVLDALGLKTVLLERIKSLETAAPPVPYAWEGFKSDVRKLSDFAVEYSAHIGEDTNGAIYDELRSAADKVVERARTGLQGHEAKADYDWHVQSPQNFKNLLSQLKVDQSRSGGLSENQVQCYEAAFPIWVDQIGVYGPPSKSNSPQCRELLRLKD